MNLNKVVIILVIALLPQMYIQRVNVKDMMRQQTIQTRLDRALDRSIQDGLLALANNTEYVRGQTLSGSSRTDVIQSFFTTLSMNFDIEELENSSALLQRYVPFVILFDVDGYFVYATWNRFSDSEYGKDYRFIESPKKPYAVHLNDSSGSMEMVVNFHLDDSVELIALENGNITKLYKSIDEVVALANVSQESALKDGLESTDLGTFPTLPRGMSSNELIQWYNRIKQVPILASSEELRNLKQQTIVDEVVSVMEYYSYRHNQIANQYGLNYGFVLPYHSNISEVGAITDIGLMSFIQGVPIGNSYYNSYAFEANRISDDVKYYATNQAGFKKYHKKECSELLRVTPITFFRTKEEAALNGYFPCEICEP